MKTNPKVSVIIITFNCADFIKNAIDSVISQTYKDYEIIVIDDGSTDNTKEVLQPYEKSIRYYYQSNKGCGAARNYGVQKSKGEYIAFLDSDDIWLPRKLEIQIEVFEEKPYFDFVCSESYTIDYKGNVTNLWKKEKQNTENFESLLEENFISTLTVVMRKSAFYSVGGFDERLSNAQDYDLWLRLTKSNHNFKYINTPLAKWRSHPKNNTKNTDGRVKSYKLLLSKHELWASMPILKKFKRFSGIYYNFATSYLSTNNYSKASLNFFKSVIYNPFVGYFYNTKDLDRSAFYRVLQVYYLIFKCFFKSIRSELKNG